MTTERYSSNKDRTMQGAPSGQGMAIGRRCNDCKKPVGVGRKVYRLLDYCAACHASKAQKVAA